MRIQERKPPSPLFFRLTAGVVGGYILASIVCTLFGLVLTDQIAKEQNIVISYVIISAGIATFVYSILFAVLSERTATVWRKLLLQISTSAFAIPLAVVYALVKAGIQHYDLSFGGIMLIYSGVFGVIIGIVFRFIGLKIDRTPQSQTEPDSTLQNVQRPKSSNYPLHCPICHANLIQSTEDDLVLDICQDGCGGIWFDNHELQQVIDSACNLEINEPSTNTTNSSTHVVSEQKHPCPKCEGIYMLRHLFKGSNVEIDECPSCGGIWLDQGELQDICASQLDSESKTAPAASLDPRTAMLLADLQSDIEQSRQHTLARHDLCKFLGRRYRTGRL